MSVEFSLLLFSYYRGIKAKSRVLRFFFSRLMFDVWVTKLEWQFVDITHIKRNIAIKREILLFPFARNSYVWDMKILAI